MKFLFTTQASNDLGLLARTLPIADALTRRGHQVAFCNPAPAPSKLIAAAGFENLLLKHPLACLSHLQAAERLNLKGLLELYQSGRLQRDFGGLANFLRGLLQMTPHKFVPMSAEIWSVDHLYAGLVGMLSENWVRSECAALAALMGDYADCVVDSFNPLACIAARAAHKPLVSVIQADMHPLNRGFIWWREPPANVPSAAPAFNQVLAHYRLPPINKTEELFVGDLTLVVGMPETDPIPEPAQVTYIGPALWQAPDAALPDWCASLSTAKPIIWVYAGNPQYFAIQTPVDSVVVLEACTAALAQEDVQVVLTTGYHALPKKLLPLPKNFIHAAYAPGIALALRSQLLIHHGGYGSCQTGLYAGTPAVIIPTYSERESNARRLAAAGAAEYILPRSDAWGRKHVAVDELREKINKTLREPTYAANAQRLGAQLQRYGGAALAAELIEATCTTEASAAG